MVHVPTPRAVIVDWVTAQTVAVDAAYSTARLELAVALPTKAGRPTAVSAGCANVMIWLALDTVKLCVTAFAGRYVRLPA
jgi:hypothetical protein